MKTTTRIVLPKPKHKKPFNKKRFVKQANDVRKILEKEKNTGTGAYDVTTRAGKTEEIRKQVFLSRAGW